MCSKYVHGSIICDSNSNNNNNRNWKHPKCSAIRWLIFHMHLFTQHKVVKLNKQELHIPTQMNHENNRKEEANFRMTHTVYYLCRHKCTILYIAFGKLSM